MKNKKAIAIAALLIVVAVLAIIFVPKWLKKDEPKPAETATQAAETVEKAAEEVAETAKETAAEAAETAEKAGEEVAETAKETVAEAAETAEKAVEEVKETATEAVETAKETASEAVEEVKETATEAVETAKETASEAVEEVKETATEAVETAEKAVEEVAETAKETAAEAAKTAEAAVEEAVAVTAEAVSEKPADQKAQKIALVTDVGTIDDESFNQACWQAVEAYSKPNNVEYVYYQPTADSLDARLLSIDQAVNEGATVIVMPGYLFGATLVTAQEAYPDVTFIAVDVAAGDLTLDYTNYVDPAKNVVCVTFSEEQAGFLAGYAAVKDGYTKLGFLGGMAVPAVIRYGYGFVQGADKAAAELDKQIEINYTYGGQFFGDAAITAKMEGWYSNGTEIVFACGGGIYTSAVEAAVKYNGKVIGVDVDQHYVGDKVDDKGEKVYPYNPFVTSAMKGLQNVTETLLKEYFDGNFANYGGQIKNYSLAEGEYVGLPTVETSWCFNTFSAADYAAIHDAVQKGEVTVSNDTENNPAVTNSTVNYIQ